MAARHLGNVRVPRPRLVTLVDHRVAPLAHRNHLAFPTHGARSRSVYPYGHQIISALDTDGKAQVRRVARRSLSMATRSESQVVVTAYESGLITVSGD